ncbi:DNA internalization-related competence protein ComEC/Rec2 [Otariodibacter oris]|nr:DNA internalization-related competence protein ComEC/Rec2 [Otariodibacter oris]
MNLDRFCYFFCLASLPIIFLPSEYLYLGIVWGVTCGLWGFIRQDKAYIGLGIAIIAVYIQIFLAFQTANSVQVRKSNEEIYVSRILKQQDYQTAIITHQDGKKSYAKWQTKEPLVLGGVYQARLIIRPISSRLNLGNFDKQRWYFSLGIQQVVTIKQAEKIRVEQTFRDYWLDNVKGQLSSAKMQGILLAISFGERAWLDAQHWRTFQQTGTAHLIAISGLHIALVMGFGFFLTRAIYWLGLRVGVLQAVRSSYYIAILIGVFFAFIYSFLAGFSAPTVRALVAIIFVVVWRYYRRHYTPWQYWWRCVSLLILLNPLSLISDSFWLSILAVLGLIIWYQFFPLQSWWWVAYDKIKLPILRWIIALFHLQIGILLVFTPIQIFFFQGVSATAFLANILTVPIYSFLIMPIMLFSLVTDNLLHSWVIADSLISWNMQILEGLSFAWQDLSYQQQWFIFSIDMALLFALFGVQNFLQKWLWMSPLVAVSLSSLWFIPAIVSPFPKVKWINFDVGQGLAMALIYKEDHQSKAIVYDTGAKWRGGSMAKLEMLPYFIRNGIDVEAIFISHQDNDHAGGVNDLMEHYPNAKLIVSDEYPDFRQNLDYCLADKQWQFGNIEFKAIYPTRIVQRAKNQDSCVLMVNVGSEKILLTGDIGIQQERLFSSQLEQATFLQVGHHGSKTNTSNTLLAKIKPQFAFISAGRWNSWGLPNKQVVRRLIDQDVTIFNTAKEGMSSVSFYENKYRINTARNEWSPWYQEYLGTP